MKRTLADISIDLNRQSGHDKLPPMIFITDQTAQPFPEHVIEKLPSGSLVILRDYNFRNRYDLAVALRYICNHKKIKFSVAADLEIALAVQADGIHLPEYMTPEAKTIRQNYPDFFISVSCHSGKTVSNLPEVIIDAVLLGPVFPTESHPETFNDPSLTIGINHFSEICRRSRMAIYALGGVNENNADKLLGSGATGIAAIRGF
ncbi:MAG: thiamine phosphate synthase [Kordiimonadaceae bacterium]|nr:thiamine phosphate synthase [Kordiimonadaceae bacterium]